MTSGCTLAIRAEGDNSQLREWLVTNDWTGLGQRIYDEAMKNPYDIEGQQAPQEVDALSFEAATTRVLDEELANAPSIADGHLSAVDDCSGQLR